MLAWLRKPLGDAIIPSGFFSSRIEPGLAPAPSPRQHQHQRQQGDYGYPAESSSVIFPRHQSTPHVDTHAAASAAGPLAQVPQPFTSPPQPRQGAAGADDGQHLWRDPVLGDRFATVAQEQKDNSYLVDGCLRTNDSSPSQGTGGGGGGGGTKVAPSPLSLFQATFRSLILWYRVREKASSGDANYNAILGATLTPPRALPPVIATAAAAAAQNGASEAAAAAAADGATTAVAGSAVAGSSGRTGAGAGTSPGGDDMQYNSHSLAEGEEGEDIATPQALAEGVAGARVAVDSGAGRANGSGGGGYASVTEAMDEGEQTDDSGAGIGVGGIEEMSQVEGGRTNSGSSSSSGNIAVGVPEIEQVETELAALTAGGGVAGGGSVGGAGDTHTEGRGEGEQDEDRNNEGPLLGFLSPMPTDGTVGVAGAGLSPVDEAAAVAARWTGGANAAMAAFLNESNTAATAVAVSADVTSADIDVHVSVAGRHTLGAGADGVEVGWSRAGREGARRPLEVLAERKSGLGNCDLLPIFGGGTFELRRGAPGRSFHSILHRFFAAMVGFFGRGDSSGLWYE